MTRDQTVELLRIRWRLTGQRMGDETADTWHEALEGVDLDFPRARHTMIDLCRHSTHVSFADFCQAFTPKTRRPYDVDTIWTTELEQHRELDPNARPARTPSIFADQVRAQMAARGSSEYAQRIRDELNRAPKTERP